MMPQPSAEGFNTGTTSPSPTNVVSLRLGSGGRYHFLEAGRGVASVAVLIYHSLDAFPKNSLPGVLERFKAFSSWGWLGVHVFFAISGWCIAERLAKGRRAEESGLHFAAERFLRIYPTYWAALVVFIGVRLASLPFNTAHLSAVVPHDFIGWLAPILLLEPYFHIGSFLIVSWTLVFELGFYLFAAMALVVSQRRVGKSSVLFLIGCLLCFAPWTAHLSPAPWRVLEMWPEFFSGVAAWWAARLGRRTIGYGVLTLMLVTAAVWPAYGGINRVTAIITAWILALAWKWDKNLGQSKALRPLRWTGIISYSLYLIHQPLIPPFEHLLGRWIPSTSTGFVAVWAMAIALALVAAKCLNQFVEAPVERWRRRAT